ncbi:MAG TPA: epoxide hydrolase [Agrobacterium sp.]|uniref:alpha/beta fold hydrolase n=1 Tax=Rhizobium TaxID=379 RepID=UPI000E8C947E|nr:epoxide hydrolase [Agrobacterium sp.]
MIETIIKTRTIDMSILDQGTGPLVLLCHGFPETKHAWRRQVQALAEAGFRAVAPDMRGYGKTDVPEHVDQYTVFHCIGDLVALMDALGESEAVIVGHDWGATIAWQAALLRPDRFRAVAALSVPMMGQPPVPPSRIFPQTEQSLFYTLYFQQAGIAEREFSRDVGETLRKIFYAASGEAGARQPGDGTPNPFGMVSRDKGLLAGLPLPAHMPDWLPPRDFARLVDDFERSGFTGGLNYYRNLDRNWELQQATSGRCVNVPALFIIGERDTGLAIPGMDQIIASMPDLVPHLLGSHIISGAGHWLQQERPGEVTTLILSFLNQVAPDDGRKDGQRKSHD